MKAKKFADDLRSLEAMRESANRLARRMEAEFVERRERTGKSENKKPV